MKLSSAWFTVVFFVLSLSSIPFGVNASTVKDEQQALAGQLSAIAVYVEQAFFPTKQTPLTEDELEETIAGSVDWLKAAQEENGYFRYEYVPFEDAYRAGDNIVRQAGVLYALGEIARRDTEKKYDIGAQIENAIDYFGSLSEEDSFEEKGFQCITQNPQSSRCKLGATSLALAGILGYVERYPEKQSQYETLIESYVSFILAMKKPDEGFRNLYRLNESFQRDDESSFSNGEALLALVRYYQYSPREDVKEVIDESFSYLKEQSFDTPLYLWIMAALKDMNELWENDSYISYAKAFTDWRIEGVSRFRHTDNNYCAYTEGIASAYSLLKETLPVVERKQLRKEVAFWNQKNHMLQIKAGERYRVLETEEGIELRRLENPNQARGGFLTAHDKPTQRIDFTQHCVTTYVQTLVDIEQKQL